MSMKKAFDQTLRDLKRGVNKKVLKVPYIEQKVLDATSNEAWGPHGTLLADIALATRNYHEYQMIMSIIWKRINDTGKNWRHVYKALTVLEYLVANGSERVIDEIKEHAYQISTLSDFQYIDSSGKDQGLNVRRKSQSLVSLVNDKERIQEVRQKAAANRDKFQSTSAVGGMHRPHSYSGGYGDRFDDGRYEGRYGGRDDDRVGYGRDKEWGYKDDDRRGQYSDPYSRDDERYSRDSQERYGRESYRDDDYRGKNDEYGSRSSDREKERAYDDDDDRHSSRASSVKTEDHLQEGRRVEQKFSEQNCGAPPSYEEAVNGSKSLHYEREGETPVAKASSPTANAGPGLATADLSSSSSQVKEAAEIDEFDPRGSVSAGPAQSTNAEMDLLGSLSEELSLAITTVSSELSSAAVPASGTSYPESHFVATNSAPTSVYQSFEDPFGDTPFKATPSPDEATIQTQRFAAATSLPPAVQAEQAPPNSQKVATGGNLEFANTFDGLSFSADNGHTLPSSNSQPALHELPQSYQNDDILAGILPPTGSEAPYSGPTGQPLMQSYNNVPNFMPQAGPHAGAVSPIVSQNLGRPTAQYNSDMNSLPQSTHGFTSNLATSRAVSQQSNDDFLGGGLQAGSNRNSSSQTSASVASTGSLALVPQAPPPKGKFEPKSAVWADTLSRGLVNLNISGPKVNPNADIGIDFETLNRKEKRMEKPSATPVTSTVTMGKAMGSGSGMGRAGGTGFRPPSNHMMGPHMGMGLNGGMGMGMAGGQGIGMVGYGSVNQPVGMMGGNMNMGMGRGVSMQPINGLAPAMNMSNAYNPIMGRGAGNYGPQHPYGSGYQ